MFAVVRIGLGFWSFFVPIVTATGFQNLAYILTAFIVISGVLGVIYGPRTESLSLEEIEQKQGWAETAK